MSSTYIFSLWICVGQGKHDHLSNIHWGKVKKERDMQRANLVGKVIRLFTNVQPIEGIYISPEAHESWPAVPALRLLLCLFGLRQTVIWCASNTLQYNLTCQMVEYKQPPVTNGSRSCGFQSGEWENTLCSRKKAWIVLLFLQNLLLTSTKQ